MATLPGSRALNQPFCLYLHGRISHSEMPCRYRAGNKCKTIPAHTFLQAQFHILLFILFTVVLHVYVYVVCCGYRHMPVFMWQSGPSAELALSLNHVGAGDQTQTINLGSTCL